MIKTVISVTEAARNFADCLNRANYQNVTYVLLTNGVPGVRLVPDGQKEPKVFSGRDLANILRTEAISEGEVRAWRRDLQTARKKLKAPPDRWKCLLEPLAFCPRLDP